MKKLLIVGDGRPGHENQSIALARHRGIDYDLLRVEEPKGARRIFGRLLRLAGSHTAGYRRIPDVPDRGYLAVVGAGEGTYGAVLHLAQKLAVPSVAMMLPPSPMRKRFDRIVAQRHDRPPKGEKIVEVPANFSCPRPEGHYRPRDRAVAVMVGGATRQIVPDVEELRRQILEIRALYPGYELAVSTSPRSSLEVERMVEELDAEYCLIYRKNRINPLGDFLQHCEALFVTEESTSMISEAVAYGRSAVGVLRIAKASNSRGGKYARLIEDLEREGYLERFRGVRVNARRKIDFGRLAREVLP